MTALESKVLELLNHRVTLKMAQTVIECVKAECVLKVNARINENALSHPNGFNEKIRDAVVTELRDLKADVQEVK